MARTSSTAAVLGALCLVLFTPRCRPVTIHLLEDEMSGGASGSGGASTGGNSNSSSGGTGSGGFLVTSGGRSGGGAGRGSGGAPAGGRSGTGGDAKGGESVDCGQLCPQPGQPSPPCYHCDPALGPGGGCPPNLFCDGICGGVCVECRGSLDCGTVYTCDKDTRRCVQECGSGLPPCQPPNGICSKDGVCSECFRNDECRQNGGTRRICDGPTNTCVECFAPTDCLSNDCDFSRKLCVECSNHDADMRCATQVCIDEAFCACFDDSECFGWSPFGGKCLPLALPPGLPQGRCGCVTSGDCPPNGTCANGRCALR